MRGVTKSLSGSSIPGQWIIPLFTLFGVVLGALVNENLKCCCRKAEIYREIEA